LDSVALPESSTFGACGRKEKRQSRAGAVCPQCFDAKPSTKAPRERGSSSGRKLWGISFVRDGFEEVKGSPL
jgi:hypothetical protein